MVAWTGIEHFRMDRFDPPPPADEPEDFVVGFKLLNTCDWLPFVLFCPILFCFGGVGFLEVFHLVYCLF